MSFTPPVGAATASTRGLVKLAGDFSGTADSPTVPGLANKIDVSQKGTANGVASLDATGKVPTSQLPATAGAVTSVNTQTGAVVLTKSDVGLSNVDNTSDANKPISSATQTALDGKAALNHTHTASDISDSSAVGRSVLTAADQLTAQSALGITNTVVVVDTFADVTTPSYGTLYVVRA